ncbi:biotin/lipoyl-binding protein [Anaerobutyricum hallii]|uniref:biotin/lipoyl-binding protein n=1 Tax=Anaerobutyricum hallii TaxID=39488 RepID=UPI0035226481
MKGKKKILLAVVLVLVMAVGITSIVVIRNRNKTVVKVFPVSMLNSSDWFDTDTSLTGTLTSDYIQEVHIDGGQKVKKVYVKKGDKVKKGDILLKYNVSEKELDLKLQKLQIQSSKMEIAEMEKELKKLKNTKTVGAVNTGNSDVMNASVNLSAIKGTSLSYLVAEADKNEGTTADSNVKTQSSDTSSDATTAAGSSEATTAAGSSEATTAAGSSEATTAADSSETTTATDSSETTTADKNDTKLSLKVIVNDIGDRASGSGTEKDPYIFNLTKDGTVNGAFIKKLISEGKYAEFRSYKSEESKNPIATFELSPDTKVNVYDNDNYTVNKLNEGGDSRTLHNSIESVSERDSSSGDGSSAGNAYIYYLNVNGRVKGSVIKSLHDSKKYATFIEFDENGKEKNRYEYNPDRVFTDLEEDGLYKVSDFDNLTIRPAYKDLKADKLEDGQKDSNGKYIFYLQKGGKISGSLLNDLIKKGINAKFIEYASEKDYDNENTENANTLEITSSSKFTVELADGTGYTISYLKSKVKKDDPSKPTTEHENPTTPSTDKKIKFKQNRKRVTAGNGCLLTVVTEDGKSIDQSKVTWKLSDNISKDTTITKTKSGVWLYVDEGEPSSSVTITAQVKNVKGISKEQISRTLIVKGADTGDDGDDNNGGGSDDGSGSGSGGGIDDGTDSSGGDDNSYTAEELKAAISDKEDDIAQAKEDLHEAQISYKEAKAEVDKATVKAKLAGTVTTAYSKGTLPTDGSAAIVVKAADGMYVKTSISEMELDSVKVGGTIKCVSSDTGDEYTAEVKEISDFPTADSSNGGDTSNPNSSYYPIVAFIKDADGLSPGGSVEVSYSSKSMGTANENAVYLQKAYIRTEDKKSYVYLRDKKTKRLKKQYITIGKTMNGQYIEIVSGVTEDDNIAFPYGKNLREGVKTKISEDDSEMIY